MQLWPTQSLASSSHETRIFPTVYVECIQLQVAYTTGIITDEIANTSTGPVGMVIEALEQVHMFI